MARIFQKYVTPEGRTTIPPEIENLKQVSVGEGDIGELGGSSIKMSDMIDTGESEEADTMIKGIRNMMQFFTRLSKLVQEFG